MPVFFVQSHQIDGDTVTIGNPLRSHLAKSLRVREGETIRLGDERRVRYRVRIDRLDSRSIRASILETVHGPSPPPASVVLAQALLKGDRMSLAIQKATELGVTAILPLLTARVVARPPANRIHAIRERWQRIAADAAEQSEQWAIPRVARPMALPELFQDVPDGALACALIARDGADGFRGLPLDHAFQGTIVLAVGPEGGWTAEECRALLDRRFHSVSLGDGILRSDTAPLAALTILQYRLGNLG